MRMSSRQESIYNFIREYTEKNGYPPTLPDIAEATGFKSLGALHEQMVKIEQLGYIKRTPGKQRSIELLPYQSRNK